MKESKFDNVSDEDLEALWNDDYYDVIIPEWALPALVNDDYEGLDEEDIWDIKGFVKEMYKMGIPDVGQYCVPIDGVSPSFYPKNDLNTKGAMCYKFAIPAK